MKKSAIWGLGALGVIFFAILPFWVDIDMAFFGYYFFIVCIYIIVGQGWNLIAGYTGQISLGQNAFFGIGCYVMSLLWAHNVTHTWYYFDPVLMILAGLAAVVLSIIIGAPLLSRLRGDYFAFGTLGVGMIIEVLFIQGGHTTGGANGFYLDASTFSTMRIYYWTGLGLAVFATLVVQFLTTSRFGLALKAIREDEISAASHGVPVLRYKMYAFMVSAFLAGLAGSLYGYYIYHVQPSGVFNLNWLFYPILVVVLGGTGSVLGPVIGAFIIGWVFAYGDVYVGGYHPIPSGALIILVMRFLPNGVLGLGSSIGGRLAGVRAGGSAAPTGGVEKG
jgi:branched-chain amino acid transport system permease protein